MLKTHAQRLLVLPPAALLVSLLLVLGPPAAAAPRVDPEAQKSLKQSADVYQNLHSFSCQARTELKMDSIPGSRIIRIKLAYQRPNQAAVSVDKYDETTQYLSDGLNLYEYSPEHKELVQDKLPVGTSPAGPILTQGQSFIGLVLLKPSGLSNLADAVGVQSLTLGPPETLDGVEVRTVARVLSGRDGGRMTFLVTIGTKDHLVYRFADIILSPKPLSPDMGGVKRIDNQETYTDIHVNPVLPDSTFLPPPDAKRAEADKQDQKQ